jgi:hypothetical protein
MKEKLIEWINKNYRRSAQPLCVWVDVADLLAFVKTLDTPTQPTQEKVAPWNDPKVKWVCEYHPEAEQGHDAIDPVTHKTVECGGSGMPEQTQENIDKGYIENPTQDTESWEKELGIDAIGIEISPEYCEIARRRLEQDTLL